MINNQQLATIKQMMDFGLGLYWKNREGGVEAYIEVCKMVRSYSTMVCGSEEGADKLIQMLIKGEV